MYQDKMIPTEEYPKSMKRHKGHDFDNFIAYDFETTGLSSINDDIIEIGAIKVENGQIIEDEDHIFQVFVKPRKKFVSSFITNLTGITNNDVKDAPTIEEVMPRFLEWCDGYVMCGYNSSGFDSKFLLEGARVSGLYVENKDYDVMWFAKSKKLPIANYKLGTVASYFHIVNPKAHRALADALTTAKIFLKLKDL